MKLLPEPGFSPVQKYLAIFQISKPTYYRGVKAGTQPKAIPITDGRVAIPNCEINKHILKLLKAAAEAEEAKKQLQSEAEEEEQHKAPEQQDEEEEADEVVP